MNKLFRAKLHKPRILCPCFLFGNWCSWASKKGEKLGVKQVARTRLGNDMLMPARWEVWTETGGGLTEGSWGGGGLHTKAEMCIGTVQRATRELVKNGSALITIHRMQGKREQGRGCDRAQGLSGNRHSDTLKSAVSFYRDAFLSFCRANNKRVIML